MNKHRALIVGASGGIGSVIAAEFEPDAVVHHYHSQPPAAGLHCLKADITDFQAVEGMVAQAIEILGGVQVLINAAGVSLDGFLHKYEPKDWESVIGTNLTGTFNVIRAVLPAMRQQRFGRIITISSVVYQRPVMGTAAYSASKAGLVGLTRTIAIENASMGITCNCIALGYFDLGMGKRLSPDSRAQIEQAIPMKRFGQADDLRRTIDFIVGTEYLTGQLISLNGGLYMG